MPKSDGIRKANIPSQAKAKWMNAGNDRRLILLALSAVLLTMLAIGVAYAMVIRGFIYYSWIYGLPEAMLLVMILILLKKVLQRLAKGKTPVN